MSKQKVLNIIIVVLIIIFLGLIGVLVVINNTGDKILEVDTLKGFATDPMTVKPEVVITEPINIEKVIVDEVIVKDPAPQNDNDTKKAMQLTQKPTPTPNKLQRTTQALRTVVKGDTVSKITLEQWGNAFLWPDLYTHNTWRSNNPDLIFPGEEVKVPNRLGNNQQFTADEVASMTESYLEVYRLYQKQGPKAEASKWYTLYSATRIMPNFLTDNASQIDPADLEMAKKRMEQAKALR